jgi:hypothetical protein
MTSTNDPTIASLADATERGDRSAADALFAALYSELHRLARRELARQGVPLGLSATPLLHHAYLDMAKREGSAFPDRRKADRMGSPSFNDEDVGRAQTIMKRSILGRRR